MRQRVLQELHLSIVKNHNLYRIKPLSTKKLPILHTLDISVLISSSGCSGPAWSISKFWVVPTIFTCCAHPAIITGGISPYEGCRHAVHPVVVATHLTVSNASQQSSSLSIHYSSNHCLAQRTFLMVLLWPVALARTF